MNWGEYMINSRFGHLAAVASLVLMVLVPARAADEQPGVLWESTSQTVMEGSQMQMPAQTMKFCAAREWTRPPAGGDKNCTNSNFKIEGSKVTWTVQCTGSMAMTGVGEITFSGADSYSGQIKFTSDEMNMTIKLSGRKI